MTRSTQDIRTILVRRIIREYYSRETTLPSERDIADEFATSRTVIRGILKNLESEGYLEMISPRKRRISPAQPAPVFDPASKLVGVLGANDTVAGPEDKLYISRRRIRGIFSRLNESGLSSLTLSVSWPPSMILELLGSYRVRGLVYANEYHTLSLEMEELIYRTLIGRVPVSTFGDTERLEYGCTAGIERCSSDHRMGPQLLLRHLAERKCRKALWYFPAKERPRLAWQAERRAGYEEAARVNGIELLPLAGTLPITNEVGSCENFRRCSKVVAEAAAPFVKEGKIDAILVDSDVAVPYFQRALRELGTVPGIIPVAGYDNYYSGTRPFQWESTPPAATVDKNDFEIGRRAAELIRKRLEHDELPAESFLDMIQPQLVIPQQ